MLGVELVTDRTTKAPATAETLQVFEKMKGDWALPLVHSFKHSTYNVLGLEAA